MRSYLGEVNVFMLNHNADCSDSVIFKILNKNLSAFLQVNTLRRASVELCEAQICPGAVWQDTKLSWSFPNVNTEAVSRIQQCGYLGENYSIIRAFSIIFIIQHHTEHHYAGAVLGIIWIFNLGITDRNNDFQVVSTR